MASKNKLGKHTKGLILILSVLWIILLGLAIIAFIQFAQDSYLFLGSIFAGAILLSAIVYYYYTKYSKNISLIKEITEKIINNEDFTISTPFPNSDLGEIAHKIYKLNNDVIKVFYEHERMQEQSIKKEKDKLRMKRIMTNNLNHEIKTPIGILQGYIETMLHHSEITPQLRHKFLQKCFENIKRLDNILTSISIITRIDDGSEAILLEKVNLNDITNTISEDINLFLTSSKFSFDIDIPKDIFIKTNSSFFYTLLNNLIKNAINYSKGTEIRFILVNEDDVFYTFQFYDNGIGIDEEHLEHLFDRFYRVDKNIHHNIGGSGLGLPIVQSIIHLHGGTISVCNRSEGGLLFTFTIPKA